MTKKTPDHQLGWSVLAASRLLDTLKRNICLCSENSSNLPCYIASRANTIESLSGVPPLCSSLKVTIKSSGNHLEDRHAAVSKYSSGNCQTLITVDNLWAFKFLTTEVEKQTTF
jgi:hypothetical protein